jgi:hypothetical protein
VPGAAYQDDTIHVRKRPSTPLPQDKRDNGMETSHRDTTSENTKSGEGGHQRFQSSMVSVLLEADLEHEGLLLGEAHCNIPCIQTSITDLIIKESNGLNQSSENSLKF